MTTIEQVNTAIARYYITLNTPYDNEFIKYCDETGIDNDSFEPDVLEQLTDFDDDFPFKQTPSDPEKAIYQIIKQCYFNPDNAFNLSPC